MSCELGITIELVGIQKNLKKFLVRKKLGPSQVYSYTQASTDETMKHGRKFDSSSGTQGQKERHKEIERVYVWERERQRQMCEEIEIDGQKEKERI